MITDETLGKILMNVYEKDLKGPEFKMFTSIAVNTNKRGFCSVSNETFSKQLKKSTRTITKYLNKLQEKGFINIIQNSLRHERRIFISGIKFDKYVEPDLEEMSTKQKMFYEAFPEREIDCDVPDYVDMKKLIYNIQRSKFLKNAHNMSLKSCCIKFYKQIMAGWQDAKDISTQNINKISNNTENTIKIIARNGNFKEITVTDEKRKAIETLLGTVDPDVKI